MGGAGEAAALAAQQRQRQQAADKQWQTVLDKNKGGRTGLDGFTTDFESAGGYKGLQQMIESASPSAIMDVARHWDNISQSLTSTANELGTHVNTMLEHWTGESADNFRASAAALQESLTNGAQYASNTHYSLGQASQALTTAKQNFPGAPSELDQIGSALGGSSDIQFKQDAAKFGLAQAVKMDGGDLSAWEQVHQEAVVVMEQLGTQYNASAAQLKTPGSHSGSTVWPAPPEPPQHGGSVGGYGDTPTGPGHAGEAHVTPITGGNGGGHDTFNPGQNGGGGYNPGGGGIDGVHGGQGGGTPPGPGGTLDGGPGGPKSGTGVGGGVTGEPVIGGVTGIGSGGGRGRGGGFGGGVGGVGGLGGLGGGGLGGGLGGGRLSGAGGIGSGGLAEGEGMTAGEGAHGMSEAEKAAIGAEGEGAGGAGQGEPMGMGGGGMGGGNQNKKKRKARAGYLVEDEETWASNGASNPGVIDF
ncbi:WXG100 family type VII secretion target [Streptacidiphilus jiangxiensis]|uniref:PPE family protein n=1 Tax=Streptacidiphilus jiangxiensis TaxID=235985 RepID=A0A1H7S376_STRJI|nr:PPE domain-containing protein [Streptacidiphilus jiangxiensis]SEL67060.1 PPE family protein [Streptacidiphilus jiangxiensis]